MPRKFLKFAAVPVIAVAAWAGAPSLAHAAEPPVIGPAPSPLPFCGGQNATPQPVPYRCATKLKLIATRQVWADVFADGVKVEVTFHVLNPAPVAVPVVIIHHEGTSGAGLALDSAKGVMAPGQATITLTDSSPCREGQLDIKYAFTENGQDQGRVGGPWIRNGENCAPPITSSPPPTTPPAVAPSASPPAATPPPVVTSVAPVVVTLPKTGLADVLIVLALVGAAFVIVGAVVITRARPAE